MYLDLVSMDDNIVLEEQSNAHEVVTEETRSHSQNYSQFVNLLDDVNVTDTPHLNQNKTCTSNDINTKPTVINNNHYYQKHFDFSKLNLTFNGRSCPIEFLRRLEELKPVKGYTDYNCFQALPVLLSDFALKWYRSKIGSILNWSQFRVEFLDYFTPRDYLYLLEVELRNRKQKHNETLSEFIVEIMDLSAKLCTPLSEQTLLDIIKHNMLPEYSFHLIGRGILTINELIHFGREIESFKHTHSTFSNSLPIKQEPKVINSSNSKNITCQKCKSSGHTYKDCRKFIGIKCFKCGKPNVLTKQCDNCNPSLKNVSVLMNTCDPKNV